jgi:hypothetical protein
MKNIFFLIFLLFFTSCSESKKFDVSEINLLDNIEKYIPIKKINNYVVVENEYSGKNKKYLSIDIYNSKNLFKNNGFNYVQITVDTKNYEIHSISQIKVVKEGQFQCDKLIDESINQLKVIYKIDVDDKNFVIRNKNKQTNKDNDFAETTFFYNKKDKVFYSLQCRDFSKSKNRMLYKYTFELQRKTEELNKWFVDVKKEQIIK